MILQGTAYWAKVVGEPTHNKFENAKEWTFDVAISDETVKKLKAEGAGAYIKSPKSKEDHGGRPYLRFKRREINRDGTKAKPFKIVDHSGNDWDNSLIGNGSLINVKFNLQQVSMGVNKGAMKPSCLSIQVVKHEAYEGGFPEYDEEGTAVSSQEEVWN